MGRAKNDAPDDGEMLPNPDLAWIDEQIRLVGIRSVAELSRAITSTGERTLLGRTLSKKRKPKISEIIKMAKVLRVPLQVLCARLGYESSPNIVDVIGKITSDGKVHLYDAVSDRVPGPEDLERELKCLVMESRDTPLAGWDGAHFFYEPIKVVDAYSIGRLAVVKSRERRAPMLGTLLPRGLFQPFSGSEPIAAGALEWASPVIWIKST
jgi:hypothetical protein